MAGPTQSNFIKFTPGTTEGPPDLNSTALAVRGPGQSVGTVQLTVPAEALQSVIATRQLATTHVYKALNVIHADLNAFFPKLSDTLPASADGVLLNPDGTPAQSVSVEAKAPQYANDENPGLIAWPAPHDITDARGGFRLNLPSVPVPKNGLALRIHGASGVAEITIKRAVLLDGKLGTIPLPTTVTPLQGSIVSQLKGIQSDILATSANDVANKPDEFASPAPQITLGEGDCARFFRSNSGVIDRFRYSVLIRLIEPQMNQWTPLLRVQTANDRFIPFLLPPPTDSFWSSTSAANAVTQLNGLGHLTLVNRYPVERPIDITDFHKTIEQHPVFLPKASTLGLGYVVDMEQVWLPAGLSLGDLVYSLPLAPGEQQRIAVEERTQVSSSRDVESFSEDEFQAFRETQDSSADAVFRSAFNEAANGGSSMSSSSSTASGGATASTGIIGAIFGGGGVSAGYSNSSSSGKTNSWQNTSRDFTSNAAQDFHSSLGRVASASRRATQTSVRLATSSERQQVTTKVISNHNHNHALTMQYWQVLRHFSVTSDVDDVQLVCFVPLEIVQFLPEGQPVTLGTSPNRDFLLRRYDMVLRYYDVLYPFFARNPEFAYGMKLLKAFGANPEAQPQPSSGLQQDVVTFSLKGTFMPFEEVFVTLVAKSGARVGPVKMIFQTSTSEYITPPEQHGSLGDLLGHLKNRRLRTDDSTLLRANIILPDSIARSEIARFDVSRRFSSFAYKLKMPYTPTTLGEVIGLATAQTVSFNADQLELELGGPVIHEASALLPAPVTNPPPAIPPPPMNLLSSFSFIAGDQMGPNMPFPAVRVPPVLSYTDLLRIEAVFHHIVRNTVTYSKAVWSALTTEERAILLERFTIGVPEGGVQSADQEVPLLNCVANRVLGFFGNAAIMPFSIPPEVAASMKVTSRDIQDALLRFHRQAFEPARSSITLPARGTLGEAILGSCNSSEKIDLTRFWNWQDSPGDQADAIPASAFQPATMAAGAGPSAGTVASASPAAPGSIISIATGDRNPSSASDVVAQLIAKSPDLAKSLDLTGLAELQKQISADTQSAGSGRKEAIDSVTSIQETAMKSAADIVKSVADAAGKVAGGAATGGA